MHVLRSLTLLLIITAATIAAEERYSLIEITPAGKAEESTLAQLGVELEPGKTIGTFQAIATERDLLELRRTGLSYSVIMEDLASFYRERAAREGSLDDMGGYKTLSEIAAGLDAIHAAHSDITTAKFSIGNSLEGNPIWCMKLSDNPDVDEDEIELLFTSLIHCREPVAMEALFYFFDYLTDNYSAGSGNEATTLLDTREFYWVPCINPDGYLYNEANDPSGGGLWRKNRRNNGDGSYGVDLNRNWGINWGEDDSGSSPDPSSVLYRGPSAFSEPETQVMRDFIESRNFVAAMNYHTYSNLVLYPWGSSTYLGGLTPDNGTFDLMADSMSVLIEAVNGVHYDPGPAWAILYPVNGDANDWCYGEQTTKRKIFAFTIEIGGDADGFWPPPSRILPLSQEVFPANLFVSHYAEYLIPPDQYVAVIDGEFAEYSGDSDEILESGETGSLSLSLWNIGYLDLTGVSGELTTSSPFAAITNSTVAFGDGAENDTLHGASVFTFDVAPGIPEPFGIDFELHLTATSGLDTTLQLLAVIGPPILAESFESSFDSWTHDAAAGWNDQWHISTTRAYSGLSSAKCGDMGGGDYAAELDARLTMPVLTDLPEQGVCSFWSNIHSERSGFYPDSAYDGGLVEISVDGGAFVEIIPQEGYTHTFRYTAGPFPYTGPMPGRACFADASPWRQYTIDLSAYAGSDVQLRFRFGSDESLGNEGWYIDDVRVTGVQPVPIIPPSELTIAAEGNDIVLRWNADVNPVYRVYSDSIPDGGFGTFEGATTDTFFVITDGVSTAEKMFYQIVGTFTE